MVVVVRVVGHELKEVKDKDSASTYDVLHVKLQGLGDDNKTRAVIVVDPGHAIDFPLGENAELAFEIRQQRLNLSPLPAGVS